MKLLMITRKVDRIDAVAGFTYRWIRAFAERVDELHVICLERGDTSGLPANCHVHSLGKELGKNRVREFIRFHWFAAALVRKVDGIFSHQNPEYGILIAPWAKLYRKKLIAWYTHGAITWRLRILTILADRLVTASKESFRLATSKVTVLSHGIETDLFVPKPNDLHDTKVLLTVGRISPSKNIDIMLDLIQRLAALLPNKVVLHIVGSPVMKGDKDYRSALQRTVEQKHLEGLVTFIGPVPFEKLPDLYPTADVFLNFSDTGSLDKAVLEAMSCGIPVLTTNQAFREIFSSIDGRCFASKDPKELADRAFALLQGPLNDLRSNEREFVVRKHSLKNLIAAICELYA